MAQAHGTVYTSPAVVTGGEPSAALLRHNRLVLRRRSAALVCMYEAAKDSFGECLLHLPRRCSHVKRETPQTDTRFCAHTHTLKCTHVHNIPTHATNHAVSISHGLCLPCWEFGGLGAGVCAFRYSSRGLETVAIVWFGCDM